MKEFFVLLSLYLGAAGLTIQGNVRTSQVCTVILKYDFPLFILNDKSEEQSLHNMCAILQNWYLLTKLCFPVSPYATIDYEFENLRFVVRSAIDISNINCNI